MTDGAHRPGEFELIARYFAPLAGKGSFGLKDDAALLGVTPGKSLVLTQDAIAAGIHFLPDDPPATVAKKALRVNLSDLAAKGAMPAGFSLALGLADDWREAWLAGFAEGLAQDCATYGIALSGGDTFRTGGGAVISITAWGEIDADRYRSRLGAGAGDRLFVTGTIGDGAFGLLAHQGKLDGLSRQDRDHLEGRYLVPEPPVAFAPLIAEFASAAMDISDGFAGDLAKLAGASAIDVSLCASDVPLSPPVRKGVRDGGEGAGDKLNLALSGGDDYQILFTVPENRVEPFLEKAQKADTQVTSLATVREGTGRVTIRDPQGRPIDFGATSWAHF